MNNYTQLIFFFLFSCCCSLSAQEFDIKNLEQIIIINSTEGTIKATLYNEDKEVVPEVNKYYHWYTSHIIHRTRGGFDGILLDGSYESFFSNKNLKEKGLFSKGIKDKVWKEWYEHGELKYLFNWKEGVLHGKFYKFSPEGSLIQSGKYKKGNLHGWVYIYLDGEVFSKSKYKKGRLIKTIEFIPKTENNNKEESINDEHEYNIFQRLFNWIKGGFK